VFSCQARAAPNGAQGFNGVKELNTLAPVGSAAARKSPKGRRSRDFDAPGSRSRLAPLTRRVRLAATVHLARVVAHRRPQLGGDLRGRVPACSLDNLKVDAVPGDYGSTQVTHIQAQNDRLIRATGRPRDHADSCMQIAWFCASDGSAGRSASWRRAERLRLAGCKWLVVTCPRCGASRGMATGFALIAGPPRRCPLSGEPPRRPPFLPGVWACAGWSSILIVCGRLILVCRTDRGERPPLASAHPCR